VIAPGDVRVSGRNVNIPIGEFAVSKSPDDVLTTHALGSCVAVCIWDPVAKVAGMLHFLLPDSSINRQRAQSQPATFADSGIPLLFQEAYKLGLTKPRAIVRLIGGAEVTADQPLGMFNVGMRNVLAARSVLWKNGVLVKGELVGGSVARTVRMWSETGRVRVTSGRDAATDL
jgi:chemotaxis protein CheD